MKDNESIRIGSVIDVREAGGFTRRGEVIGLVLTRHQKIRVEFLDGKIELRDDLTNDNIELVTY
jgi:hypothetical protein